jgi:hypothetical protein
MVAHRRLYVFLLAPPAPPMLNFRVQRRRNILEVTLAKKIPTIYAEFEISSKTPGTNKD